MQLRISGSNLQVVGFMDRGETGDPNSRKIVFISFWKAHLKDTDGSEIVSGQIDLRVNEPLTTATVAIITRLLHPFEGYFETVVNGTYEVRGDYASVVADTIHGTNLQPNLFGNNDRGHIIPLQL